MLAYSLLSDSTLRQPQVTPQKYVLERAISLQCRLPLVAVLQANNYCMSHARYLANNVALKIFATVSCDLQDMVQSLLERRSIENGV